LTPVLYPTKPQHPLLALLSLRQLHRQQSSEFRLYPTWKMKVTEQQCVAVVKTRRRRESVLASSCTSVDDWLYCDTAAAAAAAVVQYGPFKHCSTQHVATRTAAPQPDSDVLAV